MVSMTDGLRPFQSPVIPSSLTTSAMVLKKFLRLSGAVVCCLVVTTEIGKVHK